MIKGFNVPVAMKGLLAMGFCLAGFSGAQGGDAPTTGLLYGTKETDSIVYRCQKNSSYVLECDFTQTAVRKKAKPEELNAILKQAREEFKSGVKVSAKECTSYGELVDILGGRKKPPKEQGLSKMSDVEKADLLKSAKAMKKFCKSKTEQDFLNVIRLGHQKNLRTCRVSSNTFKQSFKLVQDNLGGVGSWVAQGGAQGPCGIVQLSRFEPEKLDDSSVIFWKYFARKAVTNPSGEFFPGVSCKNLDESEYIYDWSSNEHALGCDYIEFSAL